MWKHHTHLGFKLLRFVNQFPPSSAFPTIQRISTHVRVFCHLLGTQRLWFACFIYLLIFGLHLSLFLTVVSIKRDLPHQPTYTANANPFEFHLQFLDFPSHFSYALSASFDFFFFFLPLGTVLSDFYCFKGNRD